MEKIFSYGTLREPHVQMSLFNRLLVGHEAQLSGFKLDYLSITNPKVVAMSGLAVHPVLTCTNDLADTVNGMVFEVSQSELEACDAYESADYQRVLAALTSGDKAWVYLAK